MIQRVKVNDNASIIHIETALGIVNIHLHHFDRDGRRIEAVEMIPRSDPCAPAVKIGTYNRFIEELPDGAMP